MTVLNKPRSAPPRSRLARTWSRINATPGLRKDVVMVVAVVVIGLIAGLTLVAKESGGLPWSHSRRTIRAQFAQAVAINLSKRQDVRVAGVTVGEISGVQPTGKGTAIISMSVDKSVPVYSNATAALRPMNPLNEMYIDLDPGNSTAPPLGSSAVIPTTQTTTPTQIDQVLSHLPDRTQAALTNLLAESNVALASAPQQLPPDVQALTGTLGQLRPIVTALQQRRRKIATLVTSLSQISSAVGSDDQRLASLLDSSQSVLGTVAGQDRSVSAALDQLPQVTSGLRTAMTSTTALTGQLNPLLRNLNASSDELPQALAKVNGLLDSVHGILPAASVAITKARPVVRSLRPVVPEVDASLVDLRPVANRLPSATATLVGNLNNLSAFVYNSAGLTVARDNNGTMVRGQLTLNVLQPLGIDSKGCLPLPSYLPCIRGGLQ